MTDSLPYRAERTDVSVDDLRFSLYAVVEIDAVLDACLARDPENADLIPYFAVLWPSALGLARWMSANRDLWPGATVLELGCGLGLPSLVAHRLGARVASTDFHPDNGPFFRMNAWLNGIESPAYFRMDWRRPALRIRPRVLIGSDLIYESDLMPPLVACVGELCPPGGLFVLADPGRPHLQSCCSLLEREGFTAVVEVVDDVFVVVFRRAEEVSP